MNTNTNKILRRFRLSFEALPASSRPDGLMADLPGARHWEIVLRTDDHPFPMRTYFTQGAAHTSAPEALEVLQCLASDANTFTQVIDALDLAAEYGWPLETDRDRDYVRAIYRACGETYEALGRLLGESDRAALLELDFDSLDE
jgi:hypothetical protein